MRLITSHENADLDALASAVAADRYYGGGSMIALGRSVAPEVADFLALHRRRFPIRRCNQIDLDPFKHLVVTDVRRRRRLSHVEPLLARRDKDPSSLRLSLWDHHRSAPDDLLSEESFVAEVGAATTLFVEAFEARGEALTPEEATLFALGIHSDTGSLMHETSTPRDAEVLAYLMRQGAALSVVKRYLDPPLDASSRHLVMALLEASRPVQVQGREITIAPLQLGNKGVGGLARIVTEAAAIAGGVAFIGLFAFGKKKVQLVARSRSSNFDVGLLMGKLGGGGHPGAAAAILKKTELDAALEKLHEAFGQQQRSGATVATAMSAPVRTLDATLSLKDADVILQGWDVSGAPVLDDDGALLGVISTEDLRRALRREQMHLPLTAVMSQRVQSAQAASPLCDALDQMVDHNVGRLPVMDGASLVGILTRTDALRVLAHALATRGR